MSARPSLALPKRMPTPNERSAARARPNGADPRAPNALLMLLEWRAPIEFFSLVAALPWLYNVPRGDGHPVLVYPGMGASDVTTLPLRRYLQSLGYVTQAWGQGLNLGPRPGVIERAAADLRALAERHGQPVSLIGWSPAASMRASSPSCTRRWRAA
jgi:hypothetical protein